MSKQRRVIVPERYLAEVEQAREALYELLLEQSPEQMKDPGFRTRLQQITGVFWKVANTNYPEATKENL